MTAAHGLNLRTITDDSSVITLTLGGLHHRQPNGCSTSESKITITDDLSANYLTLFMTASPMDAAHECINPHLEWISPRAPQWLQHGWQTTCRSLRPPQLCAPDRRTGAVQGAARCVCVCAVFLNQHFSAHRWA